MLFFLLKILNLKELSCIMQYKLSVMEDQHNKHEQIIKLLDLQILCPSWFKGRKSNSTKKALSCQRSDVTNVILKSTALFAIIKRWEPHASQCKPKSKIKKNVGKKKRKQSVGRCT